MDEKKYSSEAEVRRAIEKLLEFFEHKPVGKEFEKLISDLRKAYSETKNG